MNVDQVALARASDFFGRGLDPAERRGDLGRQMLAGIGEYHRPVDTVEQGDPQHALERADAMADRRWRDVNMAGVCRPNVRLVGKLLLIASPALVLPFLIRSTVGGGVATATEVSSIAVLYAMLIGHFLYGGVGLRKVYEMLVETASLSGAILLILGTASGMAWAVTQSGVVQEMTTALTTMRGGTVAFMAVSVIIFLVLGCLLEGLPAVLLLAPIMYPIARKLGIHDIHYGMVIVCAMNVGYMTPPIGIGLYIACRIGGASPDEVTKAILPYLVALTIGIVVIAAFPWLSTVAL